jgi:hypothetical protein
MNHVIAKRVDDWFEAYGRYASILSIPELIKDHLFEGDEKNHYVHLFFVYEDVDYFLPPITRKKEDMIITFYEHKKTIVFRWNKMVCEFYNVDYESYEEVQKLTEDMEEETESEPDEDNGEFGFGGEWWKN